MSITWYILFFTILLLIFVSILIGFFSQKRIYKLLKKYSAIKTKCEITAHELSTILVTNAELPIVIDEVNSKKTNIYNSKYKVLKLSKKVSDSIAISSLAYCSHQLGDAIQDKEKLFSYKVKKYFHPVVKILTSLFIPTALLGFFFKFSLGMPITGLIVSIISISILVLCILFYIITYRTENKSADLICKYLNDCDFFSFSNIKDKITNGQE